MSMIFPELESVHSDRPQVPENEADLTPDTQPGTIGDRIWQDLNKNGLQDIGEPGINGISLQLFNASGELVAQTETADNSHGEAGYYRFENLNTGSQDFSQQPFNPGESYTVRVTPPATYIFTVQNTDPRLTFEGDSEIDSDADRTSGQFTTFPLTNLIAGFSSWQLSWDVGLIEIEQSLLGSLQSDQIQGGRDADIIEGREGNDILDGMRGDDVLSGDQGDDTLDGNAGDDLLLGGFGNDRLKGSRANSQNEVEFDVLQGGNGMDAFILGSRQGAFYANHETNDQALILDFDPSDDKLYLHGSLDDYQVSTDRFVSQIFYDDDLIASINLSVFGEALDLATDAKFIR